MMMKNFDQSVEINHNKNWLYIPDHPHIILIIANQGLGKTNALLNLIKHQRPEFIKVYLYFKEPFEAKYQLIINGRKTIETKKLKIPNHFDFLPNFHFTISRMMRGYYS